MECVKSAPKANTPTPHSHVQLAPSCMAMSVSRALSRNVCPAILPVRFRQDHVHYAVVCMILLARVAMCRAVRNVRALESSSKIDAEHSH